LANRVYDFQYLSVVTCHKMFIFTSNMLFRCSLFDVCQIYSGSEEERNALVDWHYKIVL